MPIVELHLLEGRSVEKKRKAVEAVTKALVEALDIRSEQVRILITEHGVENFALGGQTVGQRNESTAK